MPKKITTHYSTGITPVCGMDGRWAEVTSLPADVTCKACRRSVAFKTHHPDHAIAPTGGGRPSAEGVQRLFKVYLSDDLNQWLETQKPMASTIVEALELLRTKRSKVKRKKFT